MGNNFFFMTRFYDFMIKISPSFHFVFCNGFSLEGQRSGIWFEGFGEGMHLAPSPECQRRLHLCTDSTK